MDGSCGSVSLDAYWNNVAIPFLFIVLGFGLFVLFSLSDIQFAGTEHIIRSVAGLSRRNSRPPAGAGAEGNSAPPPPPRAPEPPLAMLPVGKSPVNVNIAANMAANAARGVGKSPPAPAPAATSTAVVPYKGR